MNTQWNDESVCKWLDDLCIGDHQNLEAAIMYQAILLYFSYKQNHFASDLNRGKGVSIDEAISSGLITQQKLRNITRIMVVAQTCQIIFYSNWTCAFYDNTMPLKKLREECEFLEDKRQQRHNVYPLFGIHYNSDGIIYMIDDRDNKGYSSWVMYAKENVSREEFYLAPSHDKAYINVMGKHLQNEFRNNGTNNMIRMENKVTVDELLTFVRTSEVENPWHVELKRDSTAFQELRNILNSYLRSQWKSHLSHHRWSLFSRQHSSHRPVMPYPTSSYNNRTFVRNSAPAYMIRNHSTSSASHQRPDGESSNWRQRQDSESSNWRQLQDGESSNWRQRSDGESSWRQR